VLSERNESIPDLLLPTLRMDAEVDDRDLEEEPLERSERQPRSEGENNCTNSASPSAELFAILV
jgi:hypothetical protein